MAGQVNLTLDILPGQPLTAETLRVCLHQHVKKCQRYLESIPSGRKVMVFNSAHTGVAGFGCVTLTAAVQEPLPWDLTRELLEYQTQIADLLDEFADRYHEDNVNLPGGRVPDCGWFSPRETCSPSPPWLVCACGIDSVECIPFPTHRSLFISDEWKRFRSASEALPFIRMQQRLGASMCQIGKPPKPRACVDEPCVIEADARFRSCGS